jgi:hypothetical protein
MEQTGPPLDYRGIEAQRPSGSWYGIVTDSAGTVETWRCNHEHETKDEARICARDAIVDRLAEQTGP